jgi:hypothetical protein
VTLFDVFSKREAGDSGLPRPATDDELLAWSDQIRSVAPDPDEDLVLDLRAAPAKRVRRAPLVAAPEPAQPRRVVRARPLVAAPHPQLDNV